MDVYVPQGAHKLLDGKDYIIKKMRNLGGHRDDGYAVFWNDDLGDVKFHEMWYTKFVLPFIEQCRAELDSTYQPGWCGWRSMN